MKMNVCTLYISCVLLVLSACGSRYKTDVSKVSDVDFKVFYKSVNNLADTISVDKVRKLSQAYPNFMPVFTQGVIRIGNWNHPSFNEHLLTFLNDSLVKVTTDSVLHYEQRLFDQEEKLSEGLRTYCAFFDEQSSPRVVYMVSAFNEPIVVGNGFIAISAEQFLGENHPFYNQLGEHNYIKYRHNADRLPALVLKSWVETEHELSLEQNTLLDAMIYEGKQCFVLEKCLKNEPLEHIIGVRANQLQWLNRNEKQVWQSLVGWKHIYSTDRLLLQKHLGEAPFSSFFGNGSSPKIGVYLGYKIVSSYMKHNKSVTIPELMKNTNSKDILFRAEYNP